MTENGQTYIAQWIASLLKSAKRHSICFRFTGAPVSTRFAKLARNACPRT